MFLKHNRRRKFVWSALILTFAVITTALLLRKESSAELLREPASQIKPRFVFLGSWREPVRSSWLKLKRRFVGAEPTISIGAEVFELTSVDGPISRMREPALSNEEVRVWLLSSNEINAVRDFGLAQQDFMTTPRVTTSERRRAQLHLVDSVPLPKGAKQAPGFTFDFLPKARGESLDLLSFVTLTALSTNAIAGTNHYSLSTNVATGARMKVPYGSGILLLARKRDGTKPLGIIITPRVQRTAR